MTPLQRYVHELKDRLGTQRAVAAALGGNTSESTVSAVLKGIRGMGPEKLIALALALGRSPVTVLRDCGREDEAVAYERGFGPAAAPLHNLSTDEHALVADFRALAPDQQSLAATLLRTMRLQKGGAPVAHNLNGTTD